MLSFGFEFQLARSNNNFYLNSFEIQVHPGILNKLGPK